MQRRWPRATNSAGRPLEPYLAPNGKTSLDWNADLTQRLSAGTGQASTSNSVTETEVEGVYIISVAARLLEMHPQTLRKYERLGLIQPVRTVGMLRLYSHEDLRKVMLIRHLMDNLGLNLAGVEFALNLVNNLSVLSRRLANATNDAELAQRIRDEVTLLCGSLSLPGPVQ